MSGLTKEFLEDIGVRLDDRHFELFTEHFDKTLYGRIEDDILHSLDASKVRELGELRNSDSDQVWHWLQANVPNLGEIIRTEVDMMLAEVVRDSDRL